METLIVSKTSWGSLYCVGGLIVKNNEPIRLLDRSGNYQPASTQLEIGEIWDIKYIRPKNITAPHYEDVFVQSANFIRIQAQLLDFLLASGVKIWSGSPQKLYEGLIKFSGSDKGYIPEKGPFPNVSVGFWISDSTLTLRYDFGKARYIYDKNGTFCNIPFKGCVEPIEKIKAGSLVRVSLAKIYRPDNAPSGFYLQLSGWYTND